MDQLDITYLAFLAGFEEYGLLRSCLYSPLVPWKVVTLGDADDIRKSLAALKHTLSDQRESGWLLELRLLTENLLFPESIPFPIVSWIRSHIKLHQYLPEMDWNTAASGRWFAVPVVLVLSVAVERSERE